MNTVRDRASGWQHAKLSGHENESDVENLFSDMRFCESFSKRLGIKKIKSASVGGLQESGVTSVFGDKTKSKTDLQLTLEDDSVVNISIKKSCAGQVYLIGVDRFIEGYELQFGESIPDEIKGLLYLYFYGHPDTNRLLSNPVVTNGQSVRLIQYQRRHNRLVWESLYNLDEKLAESLLNWFKSNIDKIADFCFSKGLAKDSKEWADYVWYINLLGEDNVDTIFSIEDIKSSVKQHADLVVASKINGGSTTQLPFGFVQWHQSKMQFHHVFEKLAIIVSKKL